MELQTAFKAPAELSQSRRHAIFFILIVKMIVNMQQVAKRFKALKTELSRQKENVRGYIHDPKELLTQYSKILAEISGIPHDEMRLFVKEYIKDHLKKKLESTELPVERAAEIVYGISLKGTTAEGVNILAGAQQKVERIHDQPAKAFQTNAGARMEAFEGVVNYLSEEMSKLAGCSVKELNQAQFVLISTIIDEL